MTYTEYLKDGLSLNFYFGAFNVVAYMMLLRLWRRSLDTPAMVVIILAALFPPVGYVIARTVSFASGTLAADYTSDERLLGFIRSLTQSLVGFLLAFQYVLHVFGAEVIRQHRLLWIVVACGMFLAPAAALTCYCLNL